MSTADRDGFIWFDGKLVPWRDATVHVLTHTLHYGMGVFEGVRAYDTKNGTCIFRIEEHTQRLINSAKILGMKIPYSFDEIVDAQIEVVRENKLTSGYIRPMCFYGAEGMGLRADGLKEHLIVAAWEWGSYFSKENLQKGIRVKTSSYNKHFVNSSMCKAKANGNYINSMLALQEALNGGYDEALLLDTNGFVAEGSGENIFIVTEGKIVTPELTSALDGITRRSVIEFAHDLGIEIITKPITKDEIYIAEEAFFTGTAAEVTPIRELDDKTIGNGEMGNITKELQKLYFKVVNGEEKKYNKWLKPIK
ncbi:MAG: branched-chain-amino-acid aminotransferase [Thiotrichaceae bacterium]|jgi:branched-chain amino acid aminotransferase|nr:branched-chain amino acid transaminase [Pseudomonadota bacterium]MEC9190379.1 branched-chain amino acid transaminase [Pseudomonadota bacterium]GIR92534.1 MAG: branched-chain-amino-acid aminotransferase [Thiotrichaceae bacterium]|tara:strand:+ start:6765 stop:7688 length:924 start_codon:yes stop_codon:yes gene_type:complete